MNILEDKVVVRRLHEGECPCCFSKLNYVSNNYHIGTLEKNGMANSTEQLSEQHMVYCERCGYMKEAVQIGLKIIPVDRIFKYDINWDKKYLEENTLVKGELGKNPFNKDKE